MKNTLLILTLLIGLISCNKEGLDFVIKGTISDNSLGGGLGGARIDLYVTKAGGNQAFLESATLEENGSYSFTIPRDKDEQFDLIIEKDGYFTLNETILFSDLSASDDNVYNYATTAKSYVTFNLLNNGTVDTQDVLKIQKLNGKQGCEECCPIGIEYFNGAVDESFTCATDAYTNYRFIYWLPGGQEAFYDSVYTLPFQTSVFNITY